MITKYIILCAFSALSYGLSIGMSDKKSVTVKSDASDLFPDWVPFKNKHGDELGEFKPVKKNKVKKRLAAPINFILRAVEPEGDYFDKGGDAGSDSEDYFEKKDWSDLHRPADPVDGKVALNHTALSDIDGVVNIIIKQSDHPLTNVHRISNIPDILTKETPDESVIEEPTTQTKPEIKTEKHEEIVNEENSEEKEKQKTEEERENEEKKAKILSTVDALKIRHAEEQRAISDRAREEELYKELFDKNANIPDEIKDRPPRRKPNKKPPPPDYEEYEDQASLEDKYKIKPIHRVTEPPRSTTTTQRAKTRRVKTNKHTEVGKLSVFKNPHLYIVYDDNDNEETTQGQYITPRGNMKFSSRYTTNTTPEKEERISLVPEDSKEGEPTLFLPKKRKNRRRKMKSTTPATTTELAKTVENFKETTAFDTTAADTKQSDVASITAVDGTTGADSTGQDTTATDALTDTVPAPSEHKKEEPKDYHNEKGGGRDHKSEHSEEHEEHGKKAYEGYHEDTKTTKGHHDKEDHLGKYDDHGGMDKHHHHESGHYGDHHHEEHGKKHAKYEESGKHSKGHSTKGSHDIHKKEEYEKKVEFFEEDGDESDEEKHGGYNHEKEHAKGGHFKQGKLKAEHRENTKGESGHYGKGGHAHSHKGHKLAAGHDSHGKHHEDHGHKDRKAGGKKWIYHHGHPAKTANLVVIDRRGDQYYHGPHYYG